MAEKILKGINFPGLEDTYIIPEVDNTLKKSGSPADAKAVGDALATKQPVGNYVKTINGNTPDENGNVTIEVGSGGSDVPGVSVQSDWNVTDENDPAYIKNRPFGETEESVELLIPTEFGPFYINESLFGLVNYEDIATYTLVVGEMYRVTWDGIAYDCIAQDINALYVGGIALGNCSAFGFTGNGEPFIVYLANGYCGYLALTDASAGGAHTVGIEKIEIVVEKIDPKYLPDNIGGSSGPALPEVTTADAGKFLRVTDEGLWAAVSIPNAEGVGF